MKIGIISDETDTQHAGLGNYAVNIVKNILKLDKKNEYYLIHRRKEENEIYRMAREVIVPYNARFPFSMIRNFITLPIKLRKYDFDVVHHTSSVGPFLFSWLMPSKRRNIQTVLDIIPLLYPEAYEPAVRIAFKYLLLRAIRNADIILAGSETSKQDIIKRFGTPEKKIIVTYLAPNEKFRVLNRRQRTKALGQLNLKYGLESPYILYAGTLEAKKNILTILKAYIKLRNKGILHKLVLAGKKGYRHEEIFSFIKKSGLQNDVIWLGHVPPAYQAQDLVYIYNCASAFVFPSIYEGFGMPPIEAMKCGCPVVSSNGGSLPEVVGKAAVVLNVYDVNGYAEALERILTNKKFAHELIKKGLENAKRFSWEESAKRTLRAYLTAPSSK